MSGYSDCKGCLTHTSVPMITDFAEVDSPQHPLVILGIPPSRGLATALHRRRNVWHIVWARGYGMASTKHVATLNCPQDSDPPAGATQPLGRHRFWFNSDNEYLATLENLLQADTPFLRLTGRSRMERRASDGPKVQIEAKEVEVLICDEGLSRKCAFCGYWESIGSARFLKVGMDKEDPLYWCGSKDCIEENSQSVMVKMRNFWTGSTEPPWVEYFGSWS